MTDLDLLEAVLAADDDLSQREREAFRDMRERLLPETTGPHWASPAGVLSDKQRAWLRSAAERLGVAFAPEVANVFSGWDERKRAEELKKAKRQPYEDLPRPTKPPRRNQ